MNYIKSKLCVRLIQLVKDDDDNCRLPPSLLLPFPASGDACLFVFFCSLYLAAYYDRLTSLLVSPCEMLGCLLEREEKEIEPTIIASHMGAFVELPIIMLKGYIIKTQRERIWVSACVLLTADLSISL